MNRAAKTAVVNLLRITRRAVSGIVGDEARASTDLLGGLRRIGIDEVSYKRGHRYLLVVVDPDSGRLVWAAPGRDAVGRPGAR